MRQHQDRCEIARPAICNTCSSNVIGMWESKRASCLHHAAMEPASVDASMGLTYSCRQSSTKTAMAHAVVMPASILDRVEKAV